MDKTKYKILIIDDEVAILRMLKLAFQSTPYEVEVEEDPEVAYERIKREHLIHAGKMDDQRRSIHVSSRGSRLRFSDFW